MPTKPDACKLCVDDNNREMSTASYSKARVSNASESCIDASIQ